MTSLKCGFTVFSGVETYQPCRGLDRIWSREWYNTRDTVAWRQLIPFIGNLALSRAFGDFEYKKNKALPAEDQIITCNPEIVEHQITEEDEFLVIACDGLQTP
jgi:serine/threonine protein phosphatase PrpC